MISTTRPAPTSGHSQGSSSYQLPYELERSICEIAAHDFPKCIPNVILIAHRFKIWFEPELYRIIRSGDKKVIPPLYVKQQRNNGSIIRVLDKPRIKAFGHHVQHVLLQKKTPEEIADILECCPNVSNLALWLIQCRGGLSISLIPILEKLPLRRFSFDPSHFFPDCSSDVSLPFNQPTFHHLTHLKIINIPSNSWLEWKELALLPKLTHLAMAGAVKQELINRILEDCRTLELFITFYFINGTIPGWLRFPQKDDRVVILDSIKDPLGQWEIGARGGEDFWVTAQIEKEQAILAKKDRARAGAVALR